ncbi:hypothetical protein EI42_01873 [Thermosporothrix hazakensis]|jgi:hypothetical protein|uniref:Uncharacterized protein n=1 Tax=Thermosporothrix hazakensis TaxID=644383 RepID=A0A326U9L7_THEHA|nr:hypothetical protein EI42_01873 [Thermosporothrix hazakensis]
MQRLLDGGNEIAHIGRLHKVCICKLLDRANKLTLSSLILSVKCNKQVIAVQF